MPRSLALLAGATLLLVAPLVAQAGPTSVPRSVSLVATRAASVSVVLPAGTADMAPIPVATAWNVNPAEPISVRLVAFLDPPAGRPAEWTHSGGPNSLAAAVRGPAGTGLPLASRPVVVFTQAMAAGHARGSRSDDLPVRADGPETLNLVAITQ